MVEYNYPGIQPPLKNGGSFWMMTNPYCKKDVKKGGL